MIEHRLKIKILAELFIGSQEQVDKYRLLSQCDRYYTRDTTRLDQFGDQIVMALETVCVNYLSDDGNIITQFITEKVFNKVFEPVS